MLKITLFFPANILFFEISVSESNVATLEFSFVVVLFFAICLLFIESVCNAGDLGSLPGLGRSPGRGNGKPLQCSGFLGNAIDRGAYGLTKSWIWLSD